MADLTALAPRIRIERVFADDDRRAALLDETFWGLREVPKQLSPKWLYDERGSLLFDEITRLPEYYLTRREGEILFSRRHEIAALTRAETLVELGSGTSEKTRLLLDALAGEGTLRRFSPLDVSEEILLASANAIADRHAGIEVHAVVGDFERHLGALPPEPPRLIAFLGSTIGNLSPAQRGRFLGAVAAVLESDDWLLLGVDLVKDPVRLEAAYNDSRGLTEVFVRNALAVLDRDLGSRFVELDFEYEARWSPAESWIDLGLRSRRAQTVAIPELEIEVAFADEERLRVEVSTKFSLSGVLEELARVGLELVRSWTDDAGDFALCLATPAA
jgi:L-histidine Nalpha-methyltransferase